MSITRRASTYGDLAIWYFETSAVNYLCNHGELGTLATRQFQLKKRRDWRISPVTLWEILLTSDEGRTDELLDFSQHLFSRYLLPTPGSLVVGFIKAGLPRHEPRRSLQADAPIARAWSEIVDDKRRTLFYDKGRLKAQVRFLQGFTRNIVSIVKNDGDVLDPALFHANYDISLTSLVEQALKGTDRQGAGAKEMVHYKVALFYAVLILCAESELDSANVRKFWADVGVASMEGRIAYIVNSLPELLWRGPFATMALMSLSQSSGTYSRGLWFDCLHSIYLSYADVLVTADEHFLELSARIPDQLGSKVLFLKESEISYYPTNWLGFDCS